MDSRVIVTFSEKFVNIWQVPFAAFTICPVGGAYPLTKSGKIKNFTGKSVKRISNVLWRNKKVEVTEVFKEVRTTEGFCWSFNMLNYGDIFKDNT